MKKKIGIIISSIFIIIMVIITISIVKYYNSNIDSTQVQIEEAAKIAIQKSDKKTLKKEDLINELNKKIGEDKFKVTTTNDGYAVILTDLNKVYSISNTGEIVQKKWVTNSDNTITDGENTYNIGDYIDYNPEIPDYSERVVDFVDPIWERINSSVEFPISGEPSATVIVKGTDTYYDSDILQKGTYSISAIQNKIKVYIDGKNKTSGLTITISEGEKLLETRTVNGETKQVQYGIKYNINIKGFDGAINQIKLELQEGTLKDTSGNKNKAVAFTILNTLKATDTETEVRSNFLGNSTVTRNKIESVKIVDSLDEIKGTKWDAGILNDGSILAGYEDSNNNGLYEVYIGSDDAIAANLNSSYLFANLANAKSIEGLEKILTINVNNMSNMFLNCSTLTTLDVTSFITAKTTNMEGMFDGVRKLETLNVENFNTSSVTNMKKMFANAAVLSELNLSNFDTQKVTTMQEMFSGLEKLANIDISSFDTRNVENMQGMFSNCKTIKKIDVGKFDTSKVTQMQEMFNECNGLTEIDITKFNTAKVTNMSKLFNNCQKLISIDVSKLKTSSVTNMKGMFNGCESITYLDVSKLDITNVENMSNMFSNCTKLLTLDMGPAFTRIAETHEGMFLNCGTSQIVIYAPESIYADKNNFKLKTDSTEKINIEKGKTIIPRYKPEWSKISSSIDLQNKTVDITFSGKTNTEYYVSNATSRLTSNNISDSITVKVDGEVASSIKKNMVKQTTENGVVTTVIRISGLEESARQNGKSFKEWSGNIAIVIGGRNEKEETYSNTSNTVTLVDEYGNQSMSRIDLEVDNWSDVEYKDSTTNKNTNGVMFLDTIKPEFTYKYLQADINYEEKSLKMVFDAVDKYFDEEHSSISLGDIKLSVYNYDESGNGKWEEINVNNPLKNSLTFEKIDNGLRYTLIIKSLPSEFGNKYQNHSGYVSITIPENKIADFSGNKNETKTITVGLDEPNGKDEDKEIVDVVDPVWQIENIQMNYQTKKVTADLVGTDKFFKETNLTNEKIKILVDGIDITSTSVVKKLSNATVLNEQRDGKTVQYGVKYTIELSNFQELQKQEGKEYLEWSGTTELIIPRGTLTDSSNNSNIETKLMVGQVDFIKPEIQVVENSEQEKLNDEKNKTKTIKFKAIDKFLDTTKTNLSAEKISVYVDGILGEGITKELTYIDTVKEIPNNRYNTTYTVREYTLKLSNFEQIRTTINYEREFTDWSGYVTIKIPENTIKDTSDNGNVENILNVGDVDYIKPTITYRHLDEDIDKENKIYTMAVDITDRYYDDTKNPITLEDFTAITINGEDVIEIAKAGTIKIELSSETIENTINGRNIVIGRRYYIEFSDLDKLHGMDYSGIVTVALKEGAVEDKFNNINNTTIITSGIDIPTGGDEVVVDVVDPAIEKISSSAIAVKQNATIIFKAVDRYFAESTLTKEKIQVFVNGQEVTTGITKGLSGEPKYRENMVNGVNTKVQYGYDYTFTLDGFDSNAKQVKIRIPEGVIIDQSGNKNKETELILYNALNTTNTETTPESGFIGNSKIQRQDIENVIFTDSIPENVFNIVTKEFKNESAWDVSAMQDKSIIAWTENSNSKGAIKVYIASIYEIFANQDSSYLFSYIGYSEKCAATEVIKNIKLMNTTSIVNMQNMFANTGYNAMSILDLQDEFDTSQVTNMSNMFYRTGYNAMKKLDLKAKFNTNKVTDMSKMFNKTGYNLMETLELGNEFDTSNVTNMEYMFEDTGSRALLNLDLKGKFNTSNVNNMQYMFSGCGQSEMTQLNLGSEFDTSKVTNMKGMFLNAGKKMTFLDLGEKFDTKNVTNMTDMFNSTGYTSMVSLDLGEKFDTIKVTNMSNMFNSTGYTSMTSLDLGEKFNTSKVTDMSDMFNSTGYMAMKNINLGKQFNTSQVTNMRNMFNSIGHNVLTTLDLGDVFYTTSVTDMTNMFYSAGQNSMTTLDLGPAFNKIVSMNTTTNCGKQNEIIAYVSEQIYANKKAFKPNTNSSSTIAFNRGTVNPKYRTEWIKETTVVDETNKNITITLRGRTNAEAGIDHTSNVTSTLTANDITIFIDGVEVTSITKVVSTNTKTIANVLTGANDVLQEIVLSDFEQAMRQAGKNYKEWSGNISLKIKKKTLSDVYGNQNLQEIDTSGEMKEFIIKDTDTNKNTNGTMFADFIKPEFTYKYSKADINYEEKSLTITFNAEDKYIDDANSGVQLSDITLQVYNYDENGTGKWENVNVNDPKNTLTSTKIVSGRQYSLNVITLPAGFGNKYQNHSGYISITIPEGKITDYSGNKNELKTITVGMDEPEDENNEKEIVDVVDPVWKIEKVVIDQDKKIVTAGIVGTDKFYTENTLDLSKIQVTVDGENANSVTKEFTTQNPEILYENRDGKQVAYGVKYHIKLSNFEEESKQDSKAYFEWSGTTKLIVEANTMKDSSNNTNKETTLEMGHVDFIKPEIQQVELSEQENTTDLNNKTKTLKFKVFDKFFDKDKTTLSVEDIKVYVDGILATGLTKELTYIDTVKNIQGNTYNPTYIEREYTLKLSNFEQPRKTVNYDREFTDWSGYVTVEIPENKIADTVNNKNDKYTLDGGEVDYILPTFTYVHSEADIDRKLKAYTMTIDITDRYYDEISHEITLEDFNLITIDGEDAKELASSGKINLQLTSEELKNTISGKEIVIGRRYYLKMSELDKLNGIDYSGVVIVAIREVAVTDKKSNTNIITTITSGINIPNGSDNDNKVVDVVSPVWDKVLISATPGVNKAEITVKGSDKYKITDQLTKDKIKIIVDGIDKTNDESIVVEVGEKTYSDKSNSMEVTIKIEGYAEDAEKVYMIIPKGTLNDENGNTNMPTVFALISSLRKAYDVNGNPENSTTSKFLNGNIQRKDIEKIIFEENIQNINEKTAWDVSSVTEESDDEKLKTWEGEEVRWANKGTIYAWYNEKSVPYTVHIAGELNINANSNSSYLFANIGNGTECKEESVIENLERLNTNNVTDMSYMFYNTGYKKMKRFALPENFKINKVETIEGMFQGMGHDAMTEFNLGDKFETTNIKNMKAMFKDFASVLSKLDLGDNFYTNNVTDMTQMFENCGTNNMQTIDLGEKFVSIGRANENFATNCGKTDNCTILAPESIYEGLHKFKLAADSEITITTNAKINPIYRPEWVKLSSEYDDEQNPSQLIVKIEAKTNEDVYTSKVSANSNFSSENIKVFVDNELANIDVELINNEENKYTVILSNFEENIRQTGKSYLEWSGNVSIRIDQKVISDEYGNQNIERIEKEDKWYDILLNDSDSKEKNENGTMFIDNIKPDIVYRYSDGSNIEINKEEGYAKIVFDVVDKYFKSCNLLEDEGATAINENSVVLATNSRKLQIIVDNDMTSNEKIKKTLTRIANVTKEINGETKIIGERYELLLEEFDQNNRLENIYDDYSGIIQLVFDAGIIKDKSGNENITKTIAIDNDDGDDIANGIIVDVVKPKIYFVSKDMDFDSMTATIIFRSTDRFYDINSKVNKSDITIIDDIDNYTISDWDLETKILDYGYEYKLVLNNYDKETRIKLKIPKGVIVDQNGNVSDAIEWTIPLDNRKPRWVYTGSDSSKLDAEGTVIFNVKAEDRFLNMEKSNLQASNLSIYKDGEDITANVQIKVDYDEKNDVNTTQMRSKSYSITVSGLEGMGYYSLIFEENLLVDEVENWSNLTTISFSKTVLTSENYSEVTYFVGENRSYVNELMNVGTTGDNLNMEVYTPSSLGEIYDVDKNKNFAEGFKFENGVQNAESFAGWAVADEDGRYIYYTDETCTNISNIRTAYRKVYGIYDEVPSTVKILRAVFQQANVIFVSSNGSASNDGLSPNKPVNSIVTAFNKLKNEEMSKQIVVIMDKVEWNSNEILNKNAIITSLYGGINYTKTKNAELVIKSNMQVNGDITFDNIKITSNSNAVSDGNNYLSNEEYSNMLIANYHTIVLGRRISTSNGKYTFGAVIGGNYKTSSNNNVQSNKIIVESGKYNDIIIGSAVESVPQNTQNIRHIVQIGSKKDGTRVQNDKLQITGYIMGGQKANESNNDYMSIEIYAGTLTGENTFKKNNENASIFMRAEEGKTSGKIEYKMFGGKIHGNVYGGANTSETTEIVNNIKLYGGNIYGDIYGQGSIDEFKGSSRIYVAGKIEITGNIYGGSNATIAQSGIGTGNTEIIFATASAKIIGNIYGGSNGLQENIRSGYVSGATNIEINSGTINGNIYGSGNNSGSLTTNVVINLGNITGKIFGAGYNSSVAEANLIINGANLSEIYGGAETDGDVDITNIVLAAGKIESVYGAGLNSGARQSNVTLNGSKVTNIYGAGKESGNTENTNVILNSENVTNVYGGGHKANATNTKVTLNGATAENIYGAGEKNSETENTNIELSSGTVTNVYGGGKEANATNTNVKLNGTAIVTTIFGGSQTSGKVETSNVILRKGRVTNTFGGGEKTEVSSAKITFDGDVNTENIYGGSKDTGKTGKTEISLNSGIAQNVYGAGLNTGAGETDLILNGAEITNIYGGAKNEGNVDKTIVEINKISEKEPNIYGGNYQGGSVTETNVNIKENVELTNIYAGNYGAGNAISTKLIIDGTVTNAFGGNYQGGIANNTNVVVNGTTENAYGGNYNGGTAINTNVTIKGITTNVYGGGYNGETTSKNTNVNIEFGAHVLENIFGGGENSNIGNTSEVGNTIINIAGGTIDKDVNGGSKLAKVYGNTNINIGNEFITDSTLVQGKIVIKGNIYGAGNSIKSENRENYDLALKDTDYDYEILSVEGNTNINIDGTSGIEFSNNIYGAGNATGYTNNDNGSTIRIENLGDNTNTYKIKSIQRTDKLYIGNSNIEISGVIDITNISKNTAYTLNRIRSLNIYDNTRLYLNRGVNLVEEFNSLKTYGDVNGENYATVQINEDGTVTKNVDNRIYTLEGYNIIFAKSENEINEWGEVNGMTFFGLYAKNAAGNKIYGVYNPEKNQINTSEVKFIKGTYVEGKHKANHNIKVDGFYTNIENNGEITERYINPYEFEGYYDWIIGAKQIDYSADLIASAYKGLASADIELNNRPDNARYAYYIPNSNGVTFNALDSNVELINPLNIVGLADSTEIANSRFGITMQTSGDGWLKSSKVNIIKSVTNGYTGNSQSQEDDSSNNTKINFKIYNSANITKIQDLGKISIVMVAKSDNNTYLVAFVLNIKTDLDDIQEADARYEPSFTDNERFSNLKYTSDSTVDITYRLYVESGNSIYATSDYRVFATSFILPTNTKLTLIDKVLDKAYYYQVTQNSTYITENGKYIYKLSNFIEMGCTDGKSVYSNENSKYYKKSLGGQYEEYQLLIDFENSNIAQQIDEQDIYMQLRNANGNVKYDQRNKKITFDLLIGEDKKALMNLKLKDEQKKEIIETTKYQISKKNSTKQNQIVLNVEAMLKEQSINEETIKDTKYYEKKGGISVEITDLLGNRIKENEAKIIAENSIGESTSGGQDSIEYINSVVRWKFSDSYANINKQLKLNIIPEDISSGTYKIKIIYFYSDDGKYYGNETRMIEKEFLVNIISETYGVEIKNDNDERIIRKATGNNLKGDSGVNMNLEIGKVSKNVNVRIEVYKRKATYDENESYQNVEYESVDLEDYFYNTTVRINQQELDNSISKVNNKNEYILYNFDEGATKDTLLQVNMKLKNVNGRYTTKTGEYKLVFRMYYGVQDGEFIQEVSKTIIVVD